MKVYSVYDAEFARFGRVLQGNFSSLLSNLDRIAPPSEGTVYVGKDERLHNEEDASFLSESFYGYMPVQIGHCSGHNQKLNCLEFHKGNEINLANEDFTLILGSYFDIEDGRFDTSKAVAFRVPAKVAVEIYSTTLHYAPCGIDGSAFRVLVVLPLGTNIDGMRSKNDPWLWASNKWLLAHEESNEAKQGAYVGLVGENPTV